MDVLLQSVLRVADEIVKPSSGKHAQTEIFADARLAHIGVNDKNFSLHRRGERRGHVDCGKRLSFSPRGTGYRNYFQVRRLALLPNFQRKETVLFGGHRFWVRNSDDGTPRRLDLPAVFSPPAEIRNDAKNRQGRERLEVVDRAERRIVLFQDESQRESQSKSGGQPHQKQARSLRTVWSRRQARRLNDRESDARSNRRQSLRELCIQLFVEKLMELRLADVVLPPHIFDNSLVSRRGFDDASVFEWQSSSLLLPQFSSPGSHAGS